jgi:hypothetical protein
MYWFSILICALCTFSSPIQQREIFYEQIAFDYYSTVIVDSFPIRKKIRINEFVIDVHPSQTHLDIAKCLLPNVAPKNYKLIAIEGYKANQLNIDGDQFKLNLANIDKNKFKIKSNGKGSYPKVQISLPFYHPLDPNKTLITVYENLSDLRSNRYTLDINIDGEITSWCREERQYIKVH